MTEPRRVHVEAEDGTGTNVYQLRRWGVVDGRVWLHRLISKMAEAGVGGAVAYAGVVAAMSQTDFLELCRTVEKYTDLVGEKDGRETIIPLAKLQEHMAGRHAELLDLAIEHLGVEYGRFFDRAKRRLGALAEGASQ